MQKMVFEGNALVSERSFEAFDTYNTIHAAASDSVIEQAISLCLQVHANFNRFSESSELAHIARSSGEWTRCSSDLAYMVNVAKALYEETKGSYNIALSPVLALWNFEKKDFPVPDEQSLQEALQFCDLSRVKLESGFIFTPSNMKLDLGSIAKGYAADIAASFLVDQGCTQGFLNFGGTVLALGPKQGRRAWVFGLQEPYCAHGERFWALLECFKGAFATSGSYERGMTINGHRYHHILDPRNGMPVSNGVLEVTVYAGSAMMADALSTTLFVLGPDEGMKLANDLEVGVLFRLEDRRVVMTEGFPAKLVSKDWPYDCGWDKEPL